MAQFRVGQAVKVKGYKSIGTIKKVDDNGNPLEVEIDGQIVEAVGLVLQAVSLIKKLFLLIKSIFK